MDCMLDGEDGLQGEVGIKRRLSLGVTKVVVVVVFLYFGDDESRRARRITCRRLAIIRTESRELRNTWVWRSQVCSRSRVLLKSL